MKYYALLCVFLCGCLGQTTISVDKATRDLKAQVVELENSNMTLKEKENKYRAMINAGRIGLASVMEQERQEEIALARKVALFTSLFSILGFVAAGILLYLGSKTFGMIALVGSASLLAGCLLFASVIQYAGPLLSGLLGLTIIGFLGYEFWKHRRALHFVADEPYTIPSVAPKVPPAPVQRLVSRVKRKAVKIADKAAKSLPDVISKVG